jgi:hypothetical protein
VESLQKSKQIFRREAPKTPSFAGIFLVTLGDFGEVRRINLFLFGCGSCWEAVNCGAVFTWIAICKSIHRWLTWPIGCIHC